MSPPQEFEIELEGSQTLRLLCYEKCCSRTRQARDEGENTERIVAKGQITVGGGALGGASQWYEIRTTNYYGTIHYI